MAEYTSNYGLYKPNRNDIDMEVDTTLAENFGKIDAGLAQIVEEMTLQGDTTLTYDAEGNLTKEETPVGVTTYEYENGRLVKSLEEKDGKTIESTFNFDTEGNLLSINRVVI
jgi:YD repeat-containing protein